MNTALHATFDGPESVRQALKALRRSNTPMVEIAVFATNPEIEQQIRSEEHEEPALTHGSSAGAAVGSVMGAAIAAPAALLLPVAIPAFVLGGAAIGAIGGSVAGAILGTGYELQQQAAKQDLAKGRILVILIVQNDHAADAEAMLVQAGGHLLRPAKSDKAAQTRA